MSLMSANRAGPALHEERASFPVELYLVTGKSTYKGYLVVTCINKRYYRAEAVV